MAEMTHREFLAPRTMTTWRTLTIVEGDAVEKLRGLPDESVQCCVTSPPYWGLRDYGVEGQIGLEETPEVYVSKIVEVFREMRRVLKNDGTLWLNLGDSYSGVMFGARGGSEKQVSNRGTQGDRLINFDTSNWKPKNLIGIPWRVAFALQADGCYLRSDIIWSKPNPMPESITDRPTKAHEYLFLLTKSGRYYYDAEAIAEPVSESMIQQIEQGYHGHATKLFDLAGAQDASATKSRIIEGARKRLTSGKWSDENPQSNGHRLVESVANARAKGTAHDSAFGLTRNKRSVWTVPTAPYAEAHFATYPPDLIKPCILAGTKPGDMVLDPFAGSGTTGMVAIKLGRKAVLIELNADYIQMIERRCQVTLGFLF